MTSGHLRLLAHQCRWSLHPVRLYLCPARSQRRSSACGGWLVARRSRSRWRWLLAWGRDAERRSSLSTCRGCPSRSGASLAGRPPGRGTRWGRALLDVLRVLTVGITLPVEEASRRARRRGSAAARRAVACAAPPRAGAGWLPRRLLAWHQLSRVAALLPRCFPIALIFAFDLYKPAWLKFLVVVLPPFHLLIARGVENLASLTISRLTHQVITPYVLRFTRYAFSSLSSLRTPPSTTFTLTLPTPATTIAKSRPTLLLARVPAMRLFSTRPTSGRSLPTTTPTGTSTRLPTGPMRPGSRVSWLR